MPPPNDQHSSEQKSLGEQRPSEQKSLDERHVEGVVASVKRTRTLLFAVTMLSAWLFGIQLLGWFQWGPTRAVFSRSILETIDATIDSIRPDSAYLTIPYDKLRAPDRIAALSGELQIITFIADSTLRTKRRKLTSAMNLATSDAIFTYDSTISKGSTIARDSTKSHTATTTTPTRKLAKAPENHTLFRVEYPRGNSFFERTAWFTEYLPYIESQWGEDLGRIARLAVERGKITPDLLPSVISTRPTVTIPIIGVELVMDDVLLIMGIILCAIMLWLRYSIVGLNEEIAYIKGKAPDDLPQWKRELSSHFVLLTFNEPPRSWGYLIALITFFTPYIALLFGIVNDVLGFGLQIITYIKLIPVGNPLLNGVDNLNLWQNEAIGMLVLRWMLTVIMIYIIGRIAVKSQAAFDDIRIDLTHEDKQVGKNDDNEQIARKGIRNRLSWMIIYLGIIWFLINVIPITLIAPIIHEQDWSYGVTLVGAIIFLILLGLGILGVCWRVKRWIKNAPKQATKPEGDSSRAIATKQPAR